MMALAMFVQVMSSVFSAGFMARQAGVALNPADIVICTVEGMYSMPFNAQNSPDDDGAPASGMMGSCPYCVLASAPPLPGEPVSQGMLLPRVVVSQSWIAQDTPPTGTSAFRKHAPTRAPPAQALLA
jgi:hypothetical protein